MDPCILTGNINRGSCFIEFIKRVGEKLSLFRNEFNKFINTGTRMLDSIYHNYDINIILNSYFGVKTIGFCHTRDVYRVINVNL